MPNLVIFPARALRDPDLTDLQLMVLLAASAFDGLYSPSSTSEENDLYALAAARGIKRGKVDETLQVLREKGYLDEGFFVRLDGQ